MNHRFYTLIVFSGIVLVALLNYQFSERENNELPLMTERPNIILIVADDLGTYDLSCYGNEIIQTPNIDALAFEGIRFTKAYAASPICSPSRAAIQTGLHPARISLTEHIRGFPPVDPCWPRTPPKSMQRLPYAYKTIGEAVKQNMYETIYVGKWHLGGNNYGPVNHGYDVSFAAGGQGLPASFFPPYFNNNPYPELNTIAGSDNYLCDALTTLAIHALPDDEAPFFMNLHYYAPHVPIEGPPDLVEKYEDILGNNPDTLPRPHYAAMVEAIDRQVGRLVDSLEQRNLLDNTIIIFTSDHGALTVEEVAGFDQHTPPTTNGPLRDGKGYLFEGGVRVPLIISSPARFDPLVDDYPTINTDLFPTITHLACMPEGTLDGLPIPSVTGTTPVNRNLFWHYPHYSPQGGHPAGVVFDGQHKLIEWYSDVDSMYLFDLLMDEGESNNTVQDQAALAASLRQALQEWRVSVGAREMGINEGYDPEDCN